MKSPRPLRQEAPFCASRTVLLLLVLLLSSARGLALDSCGARSQTAPIRVENATGVGILRAAVSCTEGGEVEAYWTGIVTVEKPIVVAKGTFLAVTGYDALAEVHGNGTLSDDSRLFEVSQGGGLALTRIRLSGGSAWFGGAIYSNSANLTLDTCVFNDNVATNGSGGAVWADGGNVTIVGGAFLGNQATRYGGAVHAVDGNLAVQGRCRFEGNKAIAGGALYCGRGYLGGGTLEAVCSILDATFVGNSAARDDQEFVAELSYLDGGGAVMILYATTVDITDSTFTENYARLAGGALYGGQYSNISVNGCRFDSNIAGRYGGAICASIMTLGGNTQLTNNTASDDGGAVMGWDASGTIVFNHVSCAANTAMIYGGCFYGMGRGIINDGTVMLDNEAICGGSIVASEGSDVRVRGGTFSGGVSKKGGFLYAEDAHRVKITGGLIENNVATRQGGALYFFGETGSEMLIEGGSFINNTAMVSGGVMALLGYSSNVTITGGTFENNLARFYGGFAYITSGGSLRCEGVNITGNQAGNQGGGIYARQATRVDSTCNLVANESPQGAAIYLTNVASATLENHYVLDNLVAGGSVVYVDASAVVARGVTFESSVGLQEDSSNRAIQLDGNSMLFAEGCVFVGWLGDTVIYHKNLAVGSLVLNSCDFSYSSAMKAVVSPHSDAEIRNAVTSNLTFQNAVTGMATNSLTLVDRALNCSVPTVCGAGNCVDSALGVLCECLQSGECLNDGGELSLGIKTGPADETYSPDTVSYELVVSSAANGTTYAIWDLDVKDGALDLNVVPSSGLLPPGGAVIVSVTGTALTQDVDGIWTSTFAVKSRSNTSTVSATNLEVEIDSPFYLCRAGEYAKPRKTDGISVDISCEQCDSIIGQEGVHCESPGATLALLPVRQGYWRSNNETLEVHKCLHSEACAGNTRVSSSDDYCADGYEGPYCAVCTAGYGRSLGNTCHLCPHISTHLLIAAYTLSTLTAVLLTIVSVVFLVGGLDSVKTVRQSVADTFSAACKVFTRLRPVPEVELKERHDPEDGARTSSWNDTNSPVIGYISDLERDSGKGNAHGRRSTFNGPDPDGLELPCARPLGVVVGRVDGVELSNITVSTTGSDGVIPASRHTRQSPLKAPRVTEAAVDRNVNVNAGSDWKCKSSWLGEILVLSLRTLPMDKLKILLGVWQILAVFASITGVEFPASYTLFLSWINVLNFDLGYMLSASCVLPSMNFYHQLLATTIAPFVVAAGLMLTYQLARRRAGIGSAGVIAKRAAWSRHVTAGLLLTFLVFTSTTSAVLKTYSCDDAVGDGATYLRADYTITCETRYHAFFKAYAGLMILVYPIGIPFLYSFVLWRKRGLLNPRISSHCKSESDGASEEGGVGGFGMGREISSSILLTASNGQTKAYWSHEELQELDAKVKARTEHPELVPLMFLWRDFGSNLYYYEVVECGRRVLLTDLLIFIAPNSSMQAATACIFAFVSLLAFELIRPHDDPVDSWLYRLGCVVIFLSYFVALLIKIDVAQDTHLEALGIFLVAVNLLLVLAVLWTSWFAITQIASDADNKEKPSS